MFESVHPTNTKEPNNSLKAITPPEGELEGRNLVAALPDMPDVIKEVFLRHLGVAALTIPALSKAHQRVCAVDFLRPLRVAKRALAETEKILRKKIDESEIVALRVSPQIVRLAELLAPIDPENAIEVASLADARRHRHQARFKVACQLVRMDSTQAFDTFREVMQEGFFAPSLWDAVIRHLAPFNFSKAQEIYQDRIVKAKEEKNPFLYESVSGALAYFAREDFPGTMIKAGQIDGKISFYRKFNTYCSIAREVYRSHPDGALEALEVAFKIVKEEFANLTLISTDTFYDPILQNLSFLLPIRNERAMLLYRQIQDEIDAILQARGSSGAINAKLVGLIGAFDCHKALALVDAMEEKCQGLNRFMLLSQLFKQNLGLLEREEKKCPDVMEKALVLLSVANSLQSHQGAVATLICQRALLVIESLKHQPELVRCWLVFRALRVMAGFRKNSETAFWLNVNQFLENANTPPFDQVKQMVLLAKAVRKNNPALSAEWVERAYHRAISLLANHDETLPEREEAAVKALLQIAEEVLSDDFFKE